MKRFIFVFCLIVLASLLPALDVWQHPELADRNSLFIGILSPSISFTEGFILQPPEVNFDFVPPFFLPFSFGAYIKVPWPNLKSFGVRGTYHINLGDQKTDFYLLYVFDLGFIRNKTLEKYNDERQEIRYFDFRFGVRRSFNR